MTEKHRLAALRRWQNPEYNQRLRTHLRQLNQRKRSRQRVVWLMGSVMVLELAALLYVTGAIRPL